MQKTLTLYPVAVSNSDISGIVSSNGTGSMSYDLPTGTTNIVMIAFNTSVLWGRSAACELIEYSVSYDQRCNINQWSKLYWKMQPKKITEWSFPFGSEIYARNSSALGRNTSSDTTGDGWLGFSRTFLDSSNASGYDKSDLFDGNSILGVYLQGTNDHSVGSYKLHMRNLKATVKYNARYYARFYDENMNLVETQLLDAGEVPTAPAALNKTGYDITGWTLIGESTGEPFKTLSSSVDTDVSWQPVYTKKTYQVSVAPYYIDNSAGLFVEKYANNAWSVVEPTDTMTQMAQEKPVRTDAYYTVEYGDKIRFKANGYSTSQDLSLSLKKSGGSTTTQSINGGNGWPQVVLTINSFKDNSYVEVSATPVLVSYAINTSATAGGSITPSFSANRGNNASVRMTPNTGWILSSYAVDGSTVTPTAAQQTGGALISWNNVNAGHTVTATFEKIRFAIAFDLPTGVTVEDKDGNTLGNSVDVDYGDSPKFTFKTDSSRSLTSVLLDGEDEGFGAAFKQRTEYETQIFYIMEPHSIAVTATDDLVTIDIQDPEQGTISGETGKFIRQAADGIQLTYTVSPSAGYGLKKWIVTLDDESATEFSEDTLTITPTENKEISVVIEALDQKIRVYVEAPNPYFKNATNAQKYPKYGFGGRAVIGNKRGRDITVYAKSNAETSVEFVADPGFTFSRATIEYYDNTSMSSSSFITYEMTQSNPFTISYPSAAGVRIIADFVRNNYDVSIASSSSACSVSISPEAYGGGFDSYFFESELSLCAIPGEGWYFDRWSDTSNRSEARTLIVPANNVSIMATFKKFAYKVDVTTNEGGTASPGQNVEYGDDLVISITADYGQKIKDVLLDGESAYEHVTLTRRGGTFRISNVKERHSVEIVFTPKIYTNGRRLIDYYPPVIASIRDIQRLMDALQIQNDDMWDAISFVMDNQYIETATNEGVTMWERELGIVPEPTDTLTERKARLRLKWVPNSRFTMKWLQEWLNNACGMQVAAPTVTDYTLRVVLPWSVRWKAIFDELENFKPANILLDRTVKLPEDSSKLLAGFATETTYSYTEIPRTIESEDDA